MGVDRVEMNPNQLLMANLRFTAALFAEILNTPVAREVEAIPVT